MNNALIIIKYIFNKFIVLLFDNFEIANNVTIGWVLVSILIMGIMISNILSIAKNSQSYKINRSDENGR